VLGGGTGFVLVPENNYNDGVLPVTGDEFAPLEFSIHGATGYTQRAMTDFKVVPGPGGALAIQGNRPNFSFGYLFTSNYTSGPVDLRNIFYRQVGSYGFNLIGFGAPRSFFTNPNYVDRSTAGALANESARAKNFDSFTFEFLTRMGDDGYEVAMNNVELRLDGAGEIFILLSGIQSVSIPEGYLVPYYRLQMGLGVKPDSGSIAITDIRDGGWHHFSVCKDGSQLRFHIDGRQIFSAVTTSSYWDQYNWAYGANYELFLYNIGNLPIMARVAAFPSNTTSSSVHGLRFTPSALYTTDTFTPPSTITDLE
jgi:hypothetical protein